VAELAPALMAAARSEERAWWLRTLLVAQAPRPVFEALRDDSREAADARQEPIVVSVLLAGIALTAVSSTAASFADDPARGGIVIPVWLFIAGGLVAIVNYWLGGGALYLALRWLGSTGSYRRARHLLGLAAAPIALSLLLLPIRLALYGGDIFRSGGSDGATERWLFGALELVFVLWALALLAIGIRTAQRWSWRRSLAALAAAAAIAALLDFGLSVL
jgi:hypothetical protein